MNYLRMTSYRALLLACATSWGCGVKSPDLPKANRAPDENTVAGAVPTPTKERKNEGKFIAGLPRSSRPDDWLEDTTPRSGVSFAYRNGKEGGQYTVLETVGGGVALADYDGDGLLDLVFTGGGKISQELPIKIAGLPTALFRNLGNFQFSLATSSAALDAPGDYSHGVVAADYDRDGFPDLLVTGYGRPRLWHNEGDGTFRDVSRAAGLDFVGWSTAATWGDIDRDGWIDLYVAQYITWTPDESRELGQRRGGVVDVSPPQNYPAAHDKLFRNSQDGLFEDITPRAKLDDTGLGLGVLCADLNNDGWLDFYVANDGNDNRLYLGSPEMPLRETGRLAGVLGNENGIPEGSMGVDLADYNGDGLPDLWVTNFELEDNSLYRGNRDGSFTHATVAAGLSGSGFPYVGFGTCFDDLDGDGWPDLFVSNGNVYYHRGQKGYQQPALMYRNLQGKRFEVATESAGPYFSVPHVGRGAALGDLDNDGAPDLVVVHQNEPVSILRNRKGAKKWVGLRLRGTTSDADAIGAKVSTEFQGRQLVRWVRSGAGYLSQFDNRIVVPQAGAAASVTVTWLGGRSEVFSGLAPGRYHEIVEGEGAAETP